MSKALPKKWGAYERMYIALLGNESKQLLAIGFIISNKKKIDKSINFLRGWEEKMDSIFCMRSCEQVGV